MKGVILLLVLNGFALVVTQSIWDVGKFMGSVPEIDEEDLTPLEFFENRHRAPFIVRSFQETLDSMARAYKWENESFAWMQTVMGEQARIDVLEGELHETRLAPAIHHMKWKYFFEKFRHLDIYAVTQSPKLLRPYLKLFPFFKSSSNSYRMLPPHLWVSGGLKPSKSAVHADSHHNQHCLLKGTKKFMLISPDVPVNSPEYGWVFVEKPDGTRETGFENAYGEYAGNLNVSKIDLNAFPGWRDVPWYLAELNAGDCLYMPIDWYHYVESSAQPTVSWHIWFHLLNVWVDDPQTEAFGLRSLTPDKCFFKEDKQARRGQDQDWGSFPYRTSLCNW